MQTFVPELNFDRCAEVLDYRRLGKQRVETKQILQTLDPEYPKDGWRNHPAVKMWRGHMGALALYGMSMSMEWLRRGYVDEKCIPTFMQYMERYPDTTLPSWWGDERVHESHRSMLIQKLPEHYFWRWPDTPPDLSYVWPTPEPVV